MKILIKNHEYDLEEIGKFGREGEIYSIRDYSSLKLAKVFDVDRRTAYIQRKVTALINKIRNFNWGGIEDSIAFPELPIYEAENHKFCGFIMKNFNTHSDLFDNRYDLARSLFKNEKLDDSTAMSVIVTLFAFLQILHKAGLILGDINPDNILFNNVTLMPALIDFDSAQLGTFYSNTNRQAYTDPTVRTDGSGSKKYFIYTTDSDIYALSIVSYEFLVGMHPYFFQTTTPTDTEYKKANELSFLDYMEKNNSKINRFDFDVFENAAYKAAAHRLQEIKENHNELYEFFKKIFVEGKRCYFHPRDSKIYSFKLGQRMNEDEIPLDVIPMTKEDPDELDLFMKQFKLSL